MAHRNTTHLGVVGFLNAYLLTGDDTYLSVWRTQIDSINANKSAKAWRPRVFGAFHLEQFLLRGVHTNDANRCLLSCLLKLFDEVEVRSNLIQQVDDCRCFCDVVEGCAVLRLILS